MGYYFRLITRVLLYAPSHRQDNTYHGLCYTSRGALAGTRNSSMSPLHEGSIRRPMMNPLSYFSFQPVLHDWCNKGRGICYPVCGMVHIKEPLLLIEKSSPCGGSGFPQLVNKGRGTCIPVCGIVHIKDPLLVVALAHEVAIAGFLSSYLNGSLPHV